MQSPMTEALRRWRIIPVIIIEDAKNAVPLADALLSGGLPIAEITLRTNGALDALRRIKDAQPEMFAGAGTVLNVAQARKAKDAGAEFVVSPGFNRSVVDYCLENGIPVYPGVATASEIEAVLELGINLMKLWPIETLGGVPYLQLLGGPFVGVEFNPSGGVTATSFTTYLNQKNVVAVGGNWMAPPDWISGGQFDRIREIVRQTVTRVAAVTHVAAPRATTAAPSRAAIDQVDPPAN